MLAETVFKNFPNKIPSLSPRTPAVILAAEVCALNLFSPRPPHSPDLASSGCDIFWSPEDSTPRTPFRGRRRAETRRVCRALTFQQRVLRVRHAVSLRRWKSYVDNARNLVEQQSELCKGFTRDICRSIPLELIVVSEKNIGDFFSVLTNVYCFRLQKVVVF